MHSFIHDIHTYTNDMYTEQGQIEDLFWPSDASDPLDTGSDRRRARDRALALRGQGVARFVRNSQPAPFPLSCMSGKPAGNLNAGFPDLKAFPDPIGLS